MKLLGVLLLALVAAQGKPEPAPPDLSGVWRYSNDRADRGPQVVVMEIVQEGVRLRVRERIEFESRTGISEYTFFTDGRPTETHSTEEAPRRDPTARKEMRPKITTIRAKWKSERLNVDTKIFYTPQDFYYVSEVWSLSPDKQTLTVKRSYSVGWETQLVLVRAADPGGNPELKTRKAQSP